MGWAFAFFDCSVVVVVGDGSSGVESRKRWCNAGEVVDVVK